jgi:glycosyltransferase involved in cell wall biosynthesis
METLKAVFIAADPPMPPTGGGTRAFHFTRVLSNIADCSLFILFPVKRESLPETVLNNCTSVSIATATFGSTFISKIGILFNNIRLLFAPWSFSKKQLILTADYYASNPYPGKQLPKQVFFFFLRYVITWYAILIYRMGYSIPARSLERADQFKELKQAINVDIETSKLLWLDFSTLFPFFSSQRKDNPTLKIICNAHNIEYRILEGMKNLVKDKLEQNWFACQAAVMKKAELKGFSDCDLVITCSDEDKGEILLHLPDAAVEVIPNGVDISYFIPESCPTEHPSLLFTGNMGYKPNQDAVDYFIEKILPYVTKANPFCTFIIAGTLAGEVFEKYQARKDIEIISSPVDMRPIYNKAWIAVVPLRVGGGTRLKILEAMAMEKPVVSTFIGAEGLVFKDKHHLFIEDDELDFAEKINLLMCDRLIASSMVKLAKEIVVQKYNWDSIREEVSDVMRKYNFI